MKKKADFILAGGLAVISLALLFLIVHRAYFSNGKYLRGHAYNKAVKDVLQNRLNMAHYHAMPRSSEIVGNTLILSEIQKSKLLLALDSMLEAYTIGSFDACLSFCEPNGVSWAYNTNWLNTVKTKGYAESDTSYEDIVRIVIDLDSNHTFYKNYFSGIIVNPDEINSAIGVKNEYGKTNMPGIRVLTVDHIIPLDSSMFVLTNFITLGVTETIPLVSISPSPADILNKSGSITYANIYWLVKPSEKSEAQFCFPIVAQLYWNPDKELWTFSALARCNVWKQLEYKLNLEL